MYERILVPLDGSELSSLVLPHVEALAEKFGSSIVVIRVNPPLSTSSAAASPPQDPTLVHRLEQQAGEGQVTDIADGLRAKGYTVQMETPSGRPAHEILKAAREAQADLIAMTTHGAGGLGRLLFGSVADEVLRQAPCPVLLIRADT